MKHFTRKQAYYFTNIILLISFICFTSCIAADNLDCTQKAPFKVLFSNDTTNIYTCESPYHKKGQPITVDMLKATVDETAVPGIEVHMLQPGMGWVPLWKSKALPLEEHLAWWKATYPDLGLSQYTRLASEGNDFVEIFVNECKKKGLIPFVSLRMNDAHCLENVDHPRGGHDLHFTKFYMDHPEYRIGPDKGDWNQHVQNWAINEVRDFKFAYIKEICENYDIAGIELDFQRHPNYFRLYETTSEQRVQIMAGFIKRVREVLDRTAKPGQKRWLCVRVSGYLPVHDKLGIDLPTWVKAGVDMVNVSGYYFTDQQMDLAAIAESIPDTAKYVELTHCASVGFIVGSGYDNFTFRRTTDEQFYTTAHLAYARGFDGVSAFNFVYYRKHGRGDRGVFCEPPFYVFEHLGDKQWIAKQKQLYYIGKYWNDPRRPYRAMPQKLDRNTTAFFVDMAPPTGGWKTDAKLRIQSDQAWSDEQKARIFFNNMKIEPTDDVSEPYPSPYSSGIGKPQQYRAYIVPKKLLVDGQNQIEICLTKGDPINIIYLDIAVQ